MKGLRYTMKRRGHKSRTNYYFQHKYHDQFQVHYQQMYWRSLAIIFALIILTIFIGVGYAKAESAQTQVNSMSDNLQKVSSTSAQLASENSMFKDKLKGEFSDTASSTTKDIARYYILKYFGAAADDAERVFMCESGLNNNAIHTNTPGLGQDRGVAQLNSKFQGKRFEDLNPGIPFEVGASDINLNIKTAKAIYDSRGGNFSAWVCSKLVGVK